MAKRNPSLAPLMKEKGQISIFFSASLVVMVTIIAFVINIGLFVKAKINLQNATDAAAFSGAAVQARQLSRIAYLNWEMRNIYKEWMYKYYVIGNLNIDDVVDPDRDDGPMSFRLQSDKDVVFGGPDVNDQYNIPAVCIHIDGSQTNICKRYAIPGLPEFGSSELPGAEEASRAFADKLIGSKINDCVERTKLNMLVATTWTYNVLADAGLDPLLGRGPAILANRQGAWPKAVELAMRMRNLEFIMNREAQTQGVCNTPGSVTGCNKSIQEIMGENKMGNERIVKAFYAGYRNLGNEIDNEMKESFTLSEIQPKPYKTNNTRNASYLLVPSNKAGYEKQYLDLKLMMVNYAIFYDAMIPRADTKTSGACDVTKVAIPVPGYPLGFYKNPDVLTYYAVRGEAAFVGMFNPFSADTIKLTAYSAAKPFGGRIGPALFVQKDGDEFFTGRTDNGKFRSVPYISSFTTEGARKRDGSLLALGEFQPGVPIPVNFANSPPGYFFLKDQASPIGGFLPGGDVQFGIPNLVYDFENGYTSVGYQDPLERINKIVPGDKANRTNDKESGLYSRFQFKAFKGNIGSGVITPEALEGLIARVRAATTYETANYLVPSAKDLNDELSIDSFPFISGPSNTDTTTNTVVYNAAIYAPLTAGTSDQSDLLWNSVDEVLRTIFEYIKIQQSGIDKYRRSLNQAAREVFKTIPVTDASGSRPGYEVAARGISDINFSDPSDDQKPGTCTSVAGQFLWFFYGGPLLDPSIVTNPIQCGPPISDLLQRYFSSNVTGVTFSPTYYQMDYSYNKDMLNQGNQSPKQAGIFSAYMPGSLTGIGDDALYDSPLLDASSGTENMRRNFYSTKFVSLKSLQGGTGSYQESQTNFVIYSEGATATSGSFDTAQKNFINILQPDSIGADLTNIKY